MMSLAAMARWPAFAQHTALRTVPWHWTTRSSGTPAAASSPSMFCVYTRRSRPREWSAERSLWTLVGCLPSKSSKAFRQKASGFEKKPGPESTSLVSSLVQRPPGERKSGMPADVEAPAPRSATILQLRPSRSRAATPASDTSPRRTSKRSSGGSRWWPPRRARYFALEVFLGFAGSQLSQKPGLTLASAFRTASTSLHDLPWASSAGPAMKWAGVQPPSSSKEASALAARRARRSFSGGLVGASLALNATNWQMVCSAEASPKSSISAACGSAASNASSATPAS
mmetsp:Transcript_79778/g.234675  ORF Transcript_79778/g.234675 Transcript_79778/m.234675 type:complete len:285 (-) Transcript_79778:1006-1860(-)